MNIILSGMPGSGKTSVGRALEKLYGKTVYDVDEEIVKKHGPINAIFEKYGEEYFRDLETRAVEELYALSGVVISTGGGCLLREKNVELLKTYGKIVYLKCNLETLFSRLEGDTQRPLLRGNYKENLRELYLRRAQIYDWSADLIIETDNLNCNQVAEKIINLLK